MNDRMVYRGPDDSGVYLEDAIALGIRRLSIIDVAGGHQPLFNEDRSLVLVCNGEIYNYIELRRDLEARGHRFASGSDSETILHLYEESGVECLDALRGMFAFILWDARQGQLFAARDRMGIKPLYMAQREHVLWLSSELKAIVGAASLRPTLRPAGVYEFLLYSYPVDQRHTAIEEVERVLPGEYLLANADGVRRMRYWTPQFGGDSGLVERSDEEILDVLESAVRLHMRSDVPVAVLLSGGIDSSAVAAFVSHGPGQCAALCAGYVGHHDVDERKQAHATAAALGLSHTDIILNAEDYSKSFDELSKCCDEPVGDQAAMPQWGLYRQASALGFKVVLSGVGGDEVFFGYPQWNEAGARGRTLRPEAYRKWNGFADDPSQVERHLWLDRLATAPLRGAAESVDSAIHALRDQAPQGPDGMASVLLGGYLVHNGCQLADKLGMGCSVEVRVPLIDHVLAQAVLDLPLARRFDLDRSKVLLRRLLRGLVPDAVLRAPKRGFTPPFGYVNRLATARVDQVLDGVLVRNGFLDRPALERLCRGHKTAAWLWPNRLRRLVGLGRAPLTLFQIAAFESWYTLISGLPSPNTSNGPGTQQASA